jgi:PadR family transcriptional regulator, regulatory protein PadR
VAAGARHGYAIGRWVRDRSSEALRVEEGALYPALHRMERSGWVEASWAKSETGRRARFYTLTPAGETHLAREMERWRAHAEAVRAVLEPGRATP